eukprot:1868415-Pleurochrysis_carterae.AAC.4
MQERRKARRGAGEGVQRTASVRGAGGARREGHPRGHKARTGSGGELVGVEPFLSSASLSFANLERARAYLMPKKLTAGIGPFVTGTIS